MRRVLGSINFGAAASNSVSTIVPAKPANASNNR